MNDRQVPRSSLQTGFAIGSLTLLYYLLARLALLFATVPGNVTPVWPPAGLAVAAILLLGNWIWPSILIGAFLLHVGFHGFTLVNCLAGLGIGIGNSISAAGMAMVLRRWGDRDLLFDHAPNVFKFLALALVSPLVSATIGAALQSLTGLASWDTYGLRWWTWTTSNTFGVLIFTPVIVVWGRRGLPTWSRSCGFWLEGASLLVSTVGLSYQAFWRGSPIEYALIPLLAWSAFRFGRRGTTLLGVVISMVAIVGKFDHAQSASQAELGEILISLQFFISVVMLTALLLSAVIAERAQAEAQLMAANQDLKVLAEQLRQANLSLEAVNDDLEQRVEERTAALRSSEEKFAKVFQSSPSAIIISRVSDGMILDINDSFVSLSGYDRDRVVGRTTTDLGLWKDSAQRLSLVDRLRTQGTLRDYEGEFRIRENEIRTGLLSVEQLELNGERCLLTLVNDITARKQAEEALRLEQEKSERLLLNILPGPIADQLKQHSTDMTEPSQAIAEDFEEVSILFADIVGFTTLSAKLPPIELVNLLNQIFSRFDALADQFDLEKIKTIGDAYMVAAGLPIPRADHAKAIAEMALAMQAAMGEFQTSTGDRLQIRIGINTGVVVAGVIGRKKFIYDLWGDAVNIASRMESSGAAGQIQLTEATYTCLKDDYELQERGPIKVKGKGEMKTYWLVGRRSLVPR